MKRPLKSKRPFGPIVEVNQPFDEEAEQEVESQEPEDDSPFPVEDNGGVDADTEAILNQAETWYNEINKERNKRKMMKNYFRSMTDFEDEKIDNLLNEAGL